MAKTDPSQFDRLTVKALGVKASSWACRRMRFFRTPGGSLFAGIFCLAGRIVCLSRRA